MGRDGGKVIEGSEELVWGIDGASWDEIDEEEEVNVEACLRIKGTSSVLDLLSIIEYKS